MSTTAPQSVRNVVNADEAVGRRIHMLMWDKQVTQTALAGQLGIQQSGLAKKLRGQRGWGIDEVITCARVLGTSVAYLVGESDDTRPNPVGPTGIEPMTSTVEYERLAPVISIFGRAA